MHGAQKIVVPLSRLPHCKQFSNLAMLFLSIRLVYAGRKICTDIEESDLARAPYLSRVRDKLLNSLCNPSGQI